MASTVSSPSERCGAEAEIDVESLQAQQEELRRQGRLHTGHWAIVTLSVVITLFAWHTSRSALEERTWQRFERESERVIEHMRERLQHYEDALLSGVAAMQVQGGDMTHAEWRLYADYLDLAERYPGVGGIGVIHHVESWELDDYVERRQRESPEVPFEVHPRHRFDFHLPISYIEPERENAAAVGLDVAFETHRREAALRARRDGTTQVSGPIVLVQDEGKTPGFLFYAPYYYRLAKDREGELTAEEREGLFRGMVYVPLVVRSLVAGTLGQESREVTFAIRDGDTILYEEKGGTVGEAAYSLSETVDVYGRDWTFDVRSTTAFHADSGVDQPLLVLVCGLTIDAMLLALFAMMSRSNRRVLALAEDMTNGLSAQARKLSANNRDLASFAHVVSHDLKTPIRGIRDLTDFLEEDLGDYLASGDADPEVRRNLARLRDQATKSNTLIAGILDYSVVGIAEERQAVVDTREMIEDIGNSLRLRPGQLLADGDLPVFRTYSVRLGQVLANIIGNSFKYNDDPERAVTRVSAEREGEFYRFRVSDNGPGIEPRFRERVFDAFTTLETTNDVGSSGIGLSIVKKSVELLGGSVGIESGSSRGATFWFLWPVADASAVNEEHHEPKCA